MRPQLLALGGHSRGELSSALLGSLTRQFLEQPPCDVLVARGFTPDLCPCERPERRRVISPPPPLSIGRWQPLAQAASLPPDPLLPLFPGACVISPQRCGEGGTGPGPRTTINRTKRTWTSARPIAVRPARILPCRPVRR